MRPVSALAGLAALAALALAAPGPARAAVTRVFRQGAASYTGARDVRIDYQLYRYWDPDGNYDVRCPGCDTDLVFDGDPVDIFALIRFDLSGLPAGATVTSVDLTFRVTNTSAAFPIHELKRGFVDQEATWRQARAGVPWEQPGAAGPTDRGAAELGTFAPPAQATPFSYTLSFTADGVAAVQGWVDDPATNHGLIIGSAAPSDGAEVCGADNPTPANRPLLSVSYTTAAGPGTATFQSGTRDTLIGDGAPTNLDGQGLSVDGFESDAAVLLRFDVSSIPPWSTVVSASLDGYISNNSALSYPVYELLRDFSDTAATWTHADASTPWSLGGALGTGAPADRGATILGLWSGRNGGTFNSSPLNRSGAKLIQDWVRGVRPNHGFIIQDYSDAVGDGINWDESGSQRCDSAVPPNCTNTSPGLTVVYTEGRFAFTSPPQRIRVGAPSAPISLQRQRSDDGAPIATFAPALTVTVRSSSAGGSFAPAPTGPWSSTLAVTFPADSSDAPPFHYRDSAAGAPVLTATLNAAWVNGTQAISVSSLLLSDDVESGQVAASSGGQWSQVSDAPPNTVSAVTAAAHRGTFGLRVVDADGQAGSGPQGFAGYVHAPVGPNYYFRTWFRFSGAGQEGDAVLAAIGNPPLAELSLALPARTVNAGGLDASGAASGETGSVALAPDTWHLLELFATGIGTTAGVRRTYVNGQLNTFASAQDWSAVSADVLSAGEPSSPDRRLTATLDFDDLRASTTSPPSRFLVSAPATVPLNACTPVTVSLRDSVANAQADGPYDFAAALQLRAIPGALFSDASCSQPAYSVSFPQGVRSATVYVSPFALGTGVIAASFPDFIEGSDSFTAVTGLPLTVSPASATASPYDAVGLTAAGGSGGGYRWSFLVNRSGATLSPAGLYTAGPAPVVTDVVQVTDALGASATASIAVVRGLVIAPPKAVVFPFGQIDFFTSGGAGTARFSVSDNRSGAVVDTFSGLYNAGGASGAVDVVSVFDARGAVASAPVQVLSAPDFRVNVSGAGGFTAGGSATYSFQVVDLVGATVALPHQLQVRLSAIPGAAPVQATMTSAFTGSDAGSPPATELLLTTNGNGFASAVVTGQVSERLFVCGALLLDPRTEACVLSSVNPGAAHHVRAEAVPASAASCSPARIDVQVVDAQENNVGFTSTVQVCPSAGSGATLVSSTLANASPSGSCLVGDLSSQGTGSVFAVDGMDETVTFTATRAGLINPPVTAQVTWSGRAPSPSESSLELVGATDPAPLSTAPGSAVSVHLTPRDACGQPIGGVAAADVALQLPPPLEASGPVPDATGFLFSVTAPSCPALPSEPLPIRAQLGGAPVTAASGALAAVNVLVTCRAPRFLSQGATAARCGQPYRYSPSRAPEVEGDGPFAFSAIGMPEGMTVTPAGDLLWIPTPEQVGSHAVQLTVTGAAGSDTQQVSIEVECGADLAGPCGCGTPGAWPLGAAALIALRLRRRRSPRARAPR